MMKLDLPLFTGNASDSIDPHNFLSALFLHTYLYVVVDLTSTLDSKCWMSMCLFNPSHCLFNPRHCCLSSSIQYTSVFVCTYMHRHVQISVKTCFVSILCGIFNMQPFCNYYFTQQFDEVSCGKYLEVTATCIDVAGSRPPKN